MASTGASDLSATFVSEAFKEDTFEVIRFEGTEAISELFRFEIELFASRADISLDAMIGRSATFEIVYDDTVRSIYGVVSEARDGGMFRTGGYAYRVVLMPRISALKLSRGYQIHLDKSVPEIVASEITEFTRRGLKDLPQMRLTESDFAVSTMEDYPKADYRCQFGESDFDFISRLMEYEGLYYYFCHRTGVDRFLVGDANLFMHSGECDIDVEYDGAAGEPYLKRVNAFHRTRHRIPEAFIVNDYHYEAPDQSLLASHTADTNGTGYVHLYGEHHTTNESGARLARVRAEEAAWQKLTFEGTGHHILFEAGRTVELANHFRSALCGAYIIVAVRHFGRVRTDPDARRIDAADIGYHNAFTTISANVPFRARRVTPWPRIDGVMSAHIDAEGEGLMAEVDDTGRYHVRMPFDLSGRPDGKASGWVRLASPLSGAGEGVQFPLRKGTEVLIAHILGDPDRPVIVGTVPNPGTKSVVTSTNPATSVLASASGMRVAMADASQTAKKVTRVPPRPNLFSTIRSEAHVPGSGGAPPPSTSGTAVTDPSAAKRGLYGPSNLGAAATNGARYDGVAGKPAQSLSAAASDTPVVDTSEDYVDENKSFSIYIPDYNSSTSNSYDAYFRLGATPPTSDDNYVAEVDQLKSTFSISESKAESVLANNELGWFDFTTGGRVSITDGFIVDRLHTGSTVFSISYSTALSENAVSWEHRLNTFTLASTVASVMEYFAGSKVSATVGAFFDVSGTFKTELSLSSTFAVTASFGASIEYSAQYVRSYGSGKLEVYDGELTKSAKTITLSASQTQQAADAAQNVANKALIIAGVTGTVAGATAAAVDIELAGMSSLPSEELLTTKEKDFLTVSQAASTAIATAGIAANIVGLLSYASVKTALAVEDAAAALNAGPPELSLSSTTSEAKLSAGPSSITLDADGITLAYGTNIIKLSAAGVSIISDTLIALELSDTVTLEMSGINATLTADGTIQIGATEIAEVYGLTTTTIGSNFTDTVQILCEEFNSQEQLVVV